MTTPGTQGEVSPESICKAASSAVGSPPNAKPASPCTTGNNTAQNRLNPCRGKPFDLCRELKFESQKGNSRSNTSRTTRQLKIRERGCSMLRKIIFVVPTFALALLPVSRLGGLAGKIGADGLAWAQDSPAAGDGSSDVAAAQNSPDKASKIKFNGSGTFDTTPTTPCSADKCFSISGSVTTSVSGLGTGDVAGDGTLDNCKINKAAKKECCTLTSTQTYTFSDGVLDITFGGTICGKTPTNIKAKNAPFEITDGSGLFAGASGSGKATFTYNEDTGAGTFTFKGKLSE